MAPNKRKILEAARKHAQKGAKDRALKEYEKLLKLDPRDAKLRLEIGDAYRRWGQVDDAVLAYTKVAQQYMKEGFDARAVAVFKQIQNLDPSRHSSYEPLAELYQRMGLTSEAIAALQTAADGYHKDGKKREALELLRKMATLDPTNTTSRIKVADLLRQEQMIDEAVLEYDEVVAELERHGELEAAGAVLERVLEIQPDRVETLVRFARNQLARGSGERAEPFAKRALEAEADSPDHHELLAEVYRVQGRDDALADVYRRLAEVYRQRGDEDQARDILQRLVPPDAFVPDSGTDPGVASPDRLEIDPSEEEEGTSAFLDDEILDDDFLGDEQPPRLSQRPEPIEVSALVEDPAFDLLDPPEAEPPRAAERPAPGSAGAAAAVGDLDQLFAEASVYLRYGKRPQAIENLNQILALDPQHLAALEKLGEALAEDGDRQRAVEVWLRAADRAAASGDREAVGVLRDRIAALDPEAAATLPEDGGEALQAESTVFMEAPVRELQDDEPPSLDLDDLEIEIDDVDLAGNAAGTSSSAASSSGNGSSASMAHQITEDLEEADFYVQQGITAEAEAIYQRVLSVAPNHPLALVRLGEIAAARGDDPGSSRSGTAPAPAAGAASPVIEDAPPPAHEAPAEIDVEITRQDSASDEPGDWTEDFSDAGELDLDIPGDLSEPEPSLLEAEGSEAEEPEEEKPEEEKPEDTAVGIRAPGSEEPLVDPEELLSQVGKTLDDAGDFAPSDEAPEDLAADLSATGADGDAPFDLAAELNEALDEDTNGATTGGAGEVDDGFTTVFGEFKKGVSEALSEGDHDAHYDLGIAYREMGLLGDAEAEFQAAMASPTRRLESLHMLGLCALEQNRGQDAADTFQHALDSPGVSDEQQLAARFELGRAFESLGDVESARAAFEKVAAIDPLFCEVQERIARLEEHEKPDDDAFESFEDVIAEAGDDSTGPDPTGGREPTGADGGHESFEDLIAEANLDSDDLSDAGYGLGRAAPGPTSEASHAVDDGLGPDEEPEPVPEQPNLRRRHKISFV